MAKQFLRLLAAGAVLIGLSIGLFGNAGAQDPIAVPHPSHIHAGTCADLDPNPAYPLSDITPAAPDATVETATTVVKTTLDDLLASPYAINVHASAEDIATYVACGDITGPVVDGRVLIPLREQHDSGLSGVAILTTVDGGVSVTVYLSEGKTSGAATPDAATPVAAAVSVSIYDYGFEPAQITVPVGTTVTWTNTGAIIHTSTAKDKTWDSAILKSGESFSFTFTKSGTYTYWCSLHPTMLGTVIVTGS